MIVKSGVDENFACYVSVCLWIYAEWQDFKILCVLLCFFFNVAI